ncbi:carboxypeptidase-like regulatory domain-containing protein [Mucilaginibacter sp. Bleaf8]|uniref:TonB-dependent receptor n=1 Tax=Mucilaginibacter sp. Bleaf8 TaxID=2834430 RepID=UPI001BD105AD|nr:TonB-dependent receptor [Mucilaginibacter sp. Bleaf8]MBS7564947.1 carboxypeptidase-like regulatory domain-containing protein [Mucilaginibacter sp. Bleaf8]
MNKLLQTFLFVLLSVISVQAATIKGHVYDQKTGEPLAGATIVLEKTTKSAVTGLDGSFQIKEVQAGTYTLRISYVMYKTTVKELDVTKEKDDEDHHHIKIYLEQAGKDLQEVAVIAKKDGNTEREARRLELQSPQIMNVVSGRAIEISPDLTVANVIQRVSGVSVERNSNGDAQFAIIRGMDKRYNYTLVNGVKIPSPDNQYRYVPLDIFPADLLDRLEVSKSLTPNMEGDAIGGVTNIVMREAPNRLLISGNISTGYNQLFFDRKFTSYDYGSVNHKSPYEINGRSYQATANDFPKSTLTYKNQHPAPNVVGSLAISQRFLNNKLGILVAGSYQNTYRGSNSTLYDWAVSGTNAYATITAKNDRTNSDQQKRYGVNLKADYAFNSRNKISLYNVYLKLDNIQVRDELTTTYNGVYNPDAGNAELVYSTRSRFTQQQIYNTTLQGDHKLFSDKFKIHWAGVYSSAMNDVPDNTTISLNGIRQNFVEKPTVLVNTNPVTHRWERNTDEDKAGYLDLTYTLPVFGGKVDISAGGLYRDKQRSGFYNNYNLFTTTPQAAYGVDFNNYADIPLSVANPGGAVSNSLTYDASEKTSAGYGMFKLIVNRLEAIGGVRVEHTNQGYNLLFPAGESNPKGSQIYTDVLPSLTLKYKLAEGNQLHAVYYKALNRPGFYEIVPSKVVNEDYQDRGNPNVKRALADNYDLRYEFAPNASEQLLVGGFYKKIKDPIEYTFQADATRGQDIYYSPGNFGTAHNYGAEVDYIKYFNKFGIKANYTYTHSRIKTPKSSRIINSTTGDIETISVEQSRPLYGQAAHVGNLSLLYRDAKRGWDAQVAASYTGERINTISQFVNNDFWQKAFIQMDASAEKRFKHHISLFVKAGNLLNTPAKLFIKGTNPVNDLIKENVVSNGQTLFRSDYYKQSYLIGIRYKM